MMAKQMRDILVLIVAFTIISSTCATPFLLKMRGETGFRKDELDSLLMVSTRMAFPFCFDGLTLTDSQRIAIDKYFENIRKHYEKFFHQLSNPELAEIATLLFVESSHKSMKDVDLLAKEWTRNQLPAVEKSYRELENVLVDNAYNLFLVTRSLVLNLPKTTKNHVYDIVSIWFDHDYGYNEKCKLITAYIKKMPKSERRRIRNTVGHTNCPFEHVHILFHK